ncbi:hypothetical protein [Flavobacterium sp. KACC 22761]|uniref:hypothetical protein n=1 Tax=Flavobacterium sp. KACC 22761 TaxID=3092665 RepID=UPI002A75434B|nr:hypothetical protein [Flavobacterium sp. KACC 22761]WPO80067.1 hypothetical protein SCB73_06720 [Flavobacterium sp. KACC 22761]
MNIIELFENAGIYNANLRSFSSEDIEKAKKQFEIERSGNTNVMPDLGENLVLAMESYANQLLFVCNNRILYNFFSKKNYSRNRFISDHPISSSKEDVRIFIDKFLSKDLDAILEYYITNNRFDNIDDLFEVKEYLPESSLERLSNKVSEKLDYAIQTVNGSLQPSAVSETVEFLKYRSFYVLVSHFRSAEKDEKIRAVYNKVYNLHSNSVVRHELINPMISSLVNYNAVDSELNNLFRKNKNQLDAAQERVDNASSSSGFSGWSIAVVIIVIIRLILLMVRLGRA